MSIDLSRPLVPSMGQHDPLDGLITYSQLQSHARADPIDPQQLALDLEIRELAAISFGSMYENFMVIKGASICWIRILVSSFVALGLTGVLVNIWVFKMERASSAVSIRGSLSVWWTILSRMML